MKYYSSLLVIMVLFTSCYDVDKPDKPADLILEDEMVVILVDMAIMSSAKGINKKKLETSGIVPNEFIFKKHAIDSVRFNKSNSYYTYDIETYTKIYSRVKDSLTKLRDHYKTIDKKEKKEKAKRDSINRIERRKRDSINNLDPNYKRTKKLKAIKKF